VRYLRPAQRTRTKTEATQDQVQHRFGAPAIIVRSQIFPCTGNQRDARLHRLQHRADKRYPTIGMAAGACGGRKRRPGHGQVRDRAAERGDAGILPHVPGPNGKTPLADVRDQLACGGIRDRIEIQLTSPAPSWGQVAHCRLKIMLEQFGHRRHARFVIGIAGRKPDRGKANVGRKRAGQIQRQKIPWNPHLAASGQIGAGEPAPQGGRIQRHRQWPMPLGCP